jgi:hypothetical protein
MGATKKTTKPRKTNPGTEPDTGEDAKKSGAVRPDEMSPEVLEFIHAIDVYKRNTQRKFPNWSEILDIVKSLGYTRTR